MWSSRIAKGCTGHCSILNGARSIKKALAEPLRGHEQKIIELLDPFQDTSWASHCPEHVMMCDQAPNSETKKSSEMELLSDFGLPLNPRSTFVSHPKILL